MKGTARLYVAFVIAAGLLSGIIAAPSWPATDPSRFFAYLGLAVLAATLKVKLPGIEGTFSADFLFILVGIAELDLGHTLVIAGSCAIVQSVWKAKTRPTLVQMSFNAANRFVSATIAYRAYHLLGELVPAGQTLTLLPLAASLYFATNTMLVSGILGIIQEKPIFAVWQTWFLWSFPYYLIGSAIAVWMVSSNRNGDWKVSLLVLPPMYFAYLSYKLLVRQYGSGNEIGP